MSPNRVPTGLIILTLTAAVSLIACQRTYYAVWERLGKEKRHLLKDQVKKARSDQEKATEEFKDVLTRVKELTGFSGGDLESFYSRLKDDFEDCVERAEKIDNRIETVEDLAADLFAEWENEIRQMGNPRFKADSRKSLADTRARYKRLHRSMVTARESMDPVLARLKDYVLYLKHNLNARAVGALGREMGSIEADVKTLVQDIENSIREADRFLARFEP